MEEPTFKNQHWEVIKRQKCEVYTRVMWYHRPVSLFNKGKKSEFYSRTYFKQSKLWELSL